MFFLGVNTDSSTNTAVVAVIRKTMKNIRNYYRLCGFQRSGIEYCQAVLNDLYCHEAYRVRKRVFSQDKRPRKDVQAHPKIVVVSHGKQSPDLLLRLRRANIPADGLLIPDAGGVVPPHPKPVGIGRDFFVSEADLTATLTVLQEQGRLMVAAGGAMESLGASANGEVFSAAGLETVLSGFRPGREKSIPETDRPLVLAMAGPLWFRENVRYRQSYQSSAKSVRRFT